MRRVDRGACLVAGAQLRTRIIKRFSTAFLRAVRGAWRGIIEGRIRL
jgi:hypothetical protein